MSDVDDLKKELNRCKDLALHHNEEMKNKTFEEIVENGLSDAVSNTLRIKKIQKLILEAETND